MTKIEIKETDELLPGDRIEIHYRTVGLTWLKAAQLALLERKLDSNKNFYLLSVNMGVTPETRNQVIFRIGIKTPPTDESGGVQQAGVGIAVAFVIKAIAISAVGVVMYLSLDKIYKIVDTIVESPAGKIAVAGAGTLAIASAIIGILALLGMKKK